MIEKLFSSQVLFQTLFVFFRHDEKTLSISEIVKETGKNQSNISRTLDKLVDWGFVVRKNQVGQNLYQLNEANPFFEYLKKIFIQFDAQNKKYILFNEESNPTFLSLHYFMNGFVDDLAVREGILKQIPSLVSYFKNNYVWFYWDKYDSDKCAKESLDKLINNPSFVEELIYKKTIEKGEEAKKIYQQMQKNKLIIGKSEAVKLIDKFSEIINVQISLNMIAVFDLTNFIYSNYIKNYLQPKAKKNDLSLNSVMEKLLNPDRLTWTQLMRLDLFKLALKHRDSKGRYNRGLKKIYNNWIWLNYGYRGSEFQYEYFEQMFSEILKKDKRELKKEISYLLNYQSNIKAEKEEIYKKLDVDKKHRQFIDAISLLSYLKVYRKDVAFLLIYLTHLIVEKFNKYKFKKDNWLYLTLPEAKDLINGKLEVTKEQLVKREESCVYLSKENKLIIGEEAEKFINEITEKNDALEENSISLLEGTTASLGENGNWVYGRVKIVNTVNDLHKVEEGDILVAISTSPEMLPAMKKASAIVTDHGGITSHAAIVARELKKPCLIGAKYATKVFKDGDRVIMCPRHGYIKFE